MVREEVVHVGRHHVGHEHLFGEAHDEEEEAGADERPAEALLRALELGADVAVTDDRAGEDVREERDPGQVVDHALRRLDRAAVHVHRIRDAGERVERDADRQEQLDCRERLAGAQQPQDAVELVDEEAAVLEVAEEGEVQGDRRRQDQPAAAAGALPLGLALREVAAGDPVGQRRRQQQRHVAPVPQPVEDERRGDEEEEPRVAARDDPVEDDDDRQEDQQEGVAVEEHAAGPTRRPPAARPAASRRSARGCSRSPAAC